MEWKLDLVHVIAFPVPSVVAFLAAGTDRPWRMMAAVALLTEVVPEWPGYLLDAGDPFDLLANLLGSALALAAWLFQLFQRRIVAAPPNC